MRESERENGNEKKIKTKKRENTYGSTMKGMAKEYREGGRKERAKGRVPNECQLEKRCFADVTSFVIRASVDGGERMRIVMIRDYCCGCDCNE